MGLRYWASIALLVLSSLFVYAEDSEILFRKVSPDGGFSYGFVNAVTEDSYGFIWFGTDNGLFRYDTQNIASFLTDGEESDSILSHSIVSLYESKDKVLWIVTDNGLCSYNQQKDRFIPQKFVEPDSVSLNSTIRDITQNKKGNYFTLHTRLVCRIDSTLSNYIVCPVPFGKNDSPRCIYFDQSDVLWVGTENGTLFKSSYPYKKFELVNHQRNASIRTICEDNNSLWIGYEWGGADHITSEGALIEHYDAENTGPTKLPHNRVRKIIKDNNNNIWIATYKGLFIVSRDGNKTILADIYNGLPHNSIRELFMDSRHGIWIGTWAGGLAYYNRNDNRFLHFKRNSDRNSIQSDIISSFTEDDDHTIWIGSEDNGLQEFDRDNRSFKKFNLKNGQTPVTNIKSLAFDHHSRLWIGTLFDGLWYLDLKTKTYKKSDLFDNEKLLIYSLVTDNKGLWIGTYGYGLFYYDFNTRKLDQYASTGGNAISLTSKLIRVILKDSYGGLWVGTHNGLNYRSNGSQQFEKFKVSEDNPSSSISSNEIYTIFEDSEGLIWVGTENGLDCFNPASHQFSYFGKKDGLSGMSAYSIQEDKNKRLWIGTENGLSVLDLKDKSISVFDMEDGLQGMQFNPGSSFKCQNGELLFGGPNGFNLINPSVIKKNPHAPKVIITNLYINNKLAGVNEPENPIGQSISTSKKLKLNHLQNTLTFGFVANNFIQPRKNVFKYRLVNYNDDWVYAGKENKATFTKIPPGRYTFEVSASNNNGIWSARPQKLEIEIVPPIWAQWYAYFFYALVLFTLGRYIRKEVIIRQNLKKELLVERVKNENEEKLYQLKMKFFTNVTHEFRTPLTLILAPLDYIHRKTTHDKDILDHLDMIKRNAFRLKILIDQIIDVRKLELGKTALNPAKFDLTKLCSDIYSTFDIYAKDRSIEYSFHASNQMIDFQADPDKIEKILFNLLSNAFKYTPENGTIDFSLTQSSSLENNKGNSFLTNENIKGEGVEISVRNTGEIIAGDEIPKLFNRFYSDSQGTGIGLHLCNEYALLHNGAISVKSDEEGTVFRLILPVLTVSVLPPAEKDKVSKKLHLPVKEKEVVQKGDANRQTILIVEDNHELLRYLKSLLMVEFNVLTAENGKQGIELANAMDPQLIISDVLMPEMDGMELCQQLKQDIQTSHIPIILLTALSEKDQKIAGFNLGADAYIEKPFDAQLLLVQMRSIIKSRELLKRSFTESIDEWKANSESMPFDKQLIEKAVRAIESHLQDEEFSVEQLASELNFSRSSLHRKLRNLTNQSATEFIRSVRLNKAITLMKQGNYNMEEVSYAVGFSSPSYFSQSFKKHFNKSPKAYLEEIKQT